MENEIWRPVEGYLGLYEVSSCGRIRSLERMKWCGLHGGCYIAVPEKILKTRKSRNGYTCVNLYKDGKMKTHKVHRLVSVAFIPNPNNLPEVNHKDEDKENNHVDNLEWCTPKYNVNYGTGTERMAEKHRKPIYSVDRETGLITYWESIAEASRQLGISKGNICSCLKGRYRFAGNYVWHYVNSKGAINE